MSFQVLVATMNQKDFSKYEEMNIQSDVVFANQSDETKYEETEINGHRVKMITTQTRGVGINRNLALMYSDADICLLADDDMAYVDGYAEGIKKAFEELPDADVVIFSCNYTKNGEVYKKSENKIKRINFLNCMKYGAARVAVRKNSIMRANIYFSELFGGGAKYGSGEDTLFIVDCLKKGLKVYSHSFCIGNTAKDESSWFTGYNEKYLYDKGALYYAWSKTYASILCLQLLVRHTNIYKSAGMSFFEAYKVMKLGIQGFKNLRRYKQ